MKIPFQVGKVAVINGGSGVLGSVFSKALASCGAKVAIIGRNQDRLDRISYEIGSSEERHWV
ncbi:hypothetical protein DFO73_10646 [Cytobacillus oceanisediminis]|uniref:Short subunit dehydrogenase n=1 Tax=Cytobacillus oceanisediminis TaxID=665099 RepID=A0A2V2ZUY3_9BACI|nr:hypothetical protein DFO73_10646 [Cytobacillus oceanisediminis]